MRITVGPLRGATALVALIGMLAFSFASGAAAAKGSWNHVANIKEAAQRLTALHKQQGSQGVLKFLDACYKTQLLFSDYSKGLESCMAQDYMHSQVLAKVYASIPISERQRLGTPSPEGISDSMGQRLVAAFTQYSVSPKDADEFRRLVDKHGTPLFVKGIFPPKGKDGDTRSVPGSK